VFLDPTRTGWATVAAAYSPRARPGTPVSFPIGWDELDTADPARWTVRSVPSTLGPTDAWAAALAEARPLPPVLVTEGDAIPAPRAAALREGRRRASRSQ
jgi:DNA primase